MAQYDLLPTMADLAGGKFPLAEEIDGGSLRRVLENEGQGEIKRALDGVVFHRPNRGQSAYRTGDWKLVVTWGLDDQPVKKELFDLSKDISEQNNLAEARPEKTAALWDTLNKYLKDVNAEKVADFGGIGKKKKAKAKAAPGQKHGPERRGEPRGRFLYPPFRMSGSAASRWGQIVIRRQQAIAREQRETRDEEADAE